MSILRSLRVATVALILGASLLVASPAQAYEPGTATATRARYDAYTGAWEYSCSYAGWRDGAKVTWSCTLYDYRYDRSQGWVLVQLDRHEGSWTPGANSRTTPTYSQRVGVATSSLCVRARALSVDGGDSHMVCR